MLNRERLKELPQAYIERRRSLLKVGIAQIVRSTLAVTHAVLKFPSKVNESSVPGDILALIELGNAALLDLPVRPLSLDDNIWGPSKAANQDLRPTAEFLELKSQPNDWRELTNKMKALGLNVKANQVKNMVETILANPDQYEIKPLQLHGLIHHYDLRKSGPYTEGVEDNSEIDIGDTEHRLAMYLKYHAAKLDGFWKPFTDALNTTYQMYYGENPQISPEKVKKDYPILQFDESQERVLDRVNQWRELLDARFGFETGVALEPSDIHQYYSEVGYTRENEGFALHAVAYTLAA